MIRKQFYFQLMFIVFAGAVFANDFELRKHIEQIRTSDISSHSYESECETRLLGLLPECRSAQETGQVFTAVAKVFSRNAYANTSNLLFYVEKALAQPLDIETSSQLHIYAGNVYEIEAQRTLSTKTKATKLKAATSSYLKGLELVMQRLNVSDLQELKKNMGHPRVDIVSVSQNDPEFNTLHEQQIKQINTFDYVLQQKKLLQMRDVLIARVTPVFRQDAKVFRAILQDTVSDSFTRKAISDALKIQEQITSPK